MPDLQPSALPIASVVAATSHSATRRFATLAGVRVRLGSILILIAAGCRLQALGVGRSQRIPALALASCANSARP